MNSVFLVGNIASDIYSGKHKGRPLLRLLLLSGRPCFVSGIRLLLLDGKGKELYKSLRKGSEIGILGHLSTRHHERNFVLEVEVTNLVLLRKFSWADIEAQNNIIEQDGTKVFIQGIITTEVLFERRPRTVGKLLGRSDQYAFLQFTLCDPAFPDGVNVVVYGFLAEFLLPYLHASSEIVVDGILRQDQSGRWRIVAENVALLRNIDYIKAAAAQARLMQMGNIDEQEYHA
jgi:single-stranded DNA-binding protein